MLPRGARLDGVDHTKTACFVEHKKPLNKVSWIWRSFVGGKCVEPQTCWLGKVPVDLVSWQLP